MDLREYTFDVVVDLGDRPQVIISMIRRNADWFYPLCVNSFADLILRNDHQRWLRYV